MNHIVNINRIEEYPENELNKSGVFKMKKDEVYSSIEKIHNTNMKKYHSSITTDAMYNWIIDRCAIRSGETYLFVFKDKLGIMLKQYSTGKVGWPGDLEFYELNPLIRMFLEGDVSEC